MVLHAHIYHNSYLRSNITAPYGRPNLRIRLHLGHNQEGGHEVYMGMWWLWKKLYIRKPRHLSVAFIYVFREILTINIGLSTF
jgi:hypothetical protein